MRVPRATYRLQLNGGFTFADAAELVPYLDRLGTSDLYASPYTTARSGSSHGYDVTDHNTLNPELGSAEDHKRMVEALHARGMGQLLDWVPNHMGTGPENARWLDVLENGPASPYSGFFDINWYPVGRPELRGRVLLPVLGDHYRAALESGKLELAFDPEVGSLSVRYYEHRFPLDPRTYPMVLGEVPGMPESILADLSGLPGREASVAGRSRDAATVKERLARLCAYSPEVAHAFEERVREVNDDSELLHRVLEEQAYRLVYWRVGDDEINYRRFFSVDDLAGVRMEDERVFEETHRLVMRLISEGKVNGLRLDHPDGLYDPAEYFRRLQAAAGEALGEPESEQPLYVLAEKILAPRESLPESWPISGTTGYEFAGLVNGLFVDSSGEAGMDRAYGEFIGQEIDFGELLHRCKRHVMQSELYSELDALAERLLRLSSRGRSFDFTPGWLRESLTEVVAAFQVYRTYITPEGVPEADRERVERAVTRARERSSAADKSAYGFIRDALLLEVEGPEGRRMAEEFVMRFQQYTGPVMAKGLEDTALYIYNRLVSLNEVGGRPDGFGVSVAEFHHLTAERARMWPHSMLTTATHDTKRGEDARTRVDALSEMPKEWRERLARWARLNQHHRRKESPSPDDEYLLYQTLLGAWPPVEMDEEELAVFRERIQGYMRKAIREAQVHTSWTNVNEGYEAAVHDFVEELLTPDEHSPFLEDFEPFARRIARLGALSSLSQTLIKLTAPGVPDLYQGTELWDLSLVDPDNRRPVDFQLRERMLSGLEEATSGGTFDARSLLEDWESGRPKLYLTWRALGLRRERPELFRDGEYVPLTVTGDRADHLVAFARRLGDETAITVAPRLYAELDGGAGPLLPDLWLRTSVTLSELPHTEYRNVLTGEAVRPAEEALLAGELLQSFPVALLVAT